MTLLLHYQHLFPFDCFFLDSTPYTANLYCFLNSNY
jgi:hypothetical protein